MLVQLREDRANVEMSVGLDLGSLQSCLDGQRLLEKVESRAHLSDPTIIASHIVEGHRHPQLVRLAKLLRLLEEVERTIHILFLQVVNR